MENEDNKKVNNKKKKNKSVSYEEEIKIAKEKKKNKQNSNNKLENKEEKNENILNSKEDKSFMDIDFKSNSKKEKNKQQPIEFRGEEFTIKEDIVEESKPEIYKKSKLSIFFLIITLLVILGYAYYLYRTLDFKNLEILDIVKSGSFILIALVVILVLFKVNTKKSTPYVIFLTLILIGYAFFNVSYAKEEELYVTDFINHSYSEVIEWADKYKIELTTLHEYSDTVEINHVIMQEYGIDTILSSVKTFKVTISDGPNPYKEIVVPNFTGFTFDDVMKYIKENHLTNVEIEFQISDKARDTVIEQEGSGTLKRNDLIKFVFSYGEEIETSEVKDLKGLSLFEATAYLKRIGVKYEIDYEFSDKIQKDFVISQDKVNQVVENLKIMVSKGPEIKVPDLLKMTSNEITKWATNNNIKIKYEEVYNKEYENGQIIKTSVEDGSKISVGSEIVITISKGSLVMPEVNNVSEFKLWATSNNISFEENYEFSTTIKNGELISVNPKPGEKITENDTIVLTISKGRSVTVPNFSGLSKTEATNKCKNAGVSCTFKYGSLTESTKKDIVISQSKKSGLTVAEGSNVTITLSSGIIEKVTIPNFVGKSKSDISSSCTSLGLTCNFNYSSNFSSTKKDVALSQDKTGNIAKGTTVNITLSIGSARTYEDVFVQGDWLKYGNPELTKSTLKSKLESACPGVKFNFTFKSSNTGIGYLSPDSEVKVGPNTFVEGKTYNVIINSN